jgi:thioesterase domain-containing protein
MNRQNVQQYLYDHIPLSKAMEVRVLEASPDRVELFAPLTPNINHRETVFGGSASALAILSAWTLLHLRLTGNDCHTRLVIQRNAMHYEAPIEDDFKAICSFQDNDAWENFSRMLDRKKRARIKVQSMLECHGKKVAGFEGDFVAIIL